MSRTSVMRREQPSYFDRSLLMLPLPLTFNHNNVCLRADPLDFWHLLQIVTVRIVGSSALVRARVVEVEARDVKGASGVCYICGINQHTVIICPVKELGEGLVGLFTLYKPPLDFRDGVPNHFTVQLCAVTDQFHPRHGGFDKSR